MKLKELLKKHDVDAGTFKVIEDKYGRLSKEMEKFQDKWDDHMPRVLTGNNSHMSIILNSSDPGDK